jgi:hypothetical protein
MQKSKFCQLFLSKILTLKLKSFKCTFELSIMNTFFVTNQCQMLWRQKSEV